MPIPGNEKRSILKVAKRRQVLVLDAGRARLSSLQDFCRSALYFTWDWHPRLAPAVPIGTKTKTFAPRIDLAESLGDFRYPSPHGVAVCLGGRYIKCQRIVGSSRVGDT